MNYYIELLNSLRRGVISPVYLFFGEEGYLREQAINHFKEHFCQLDGFGLNFDLIDGETASPAEVAARADTLPFMSGKRLVVVNNATFFKGSKKGGEDEEFRDEGKTADELPLLNYLKEPLPSTCLVFNTGDPVDKRKRIYKAIAKYGRALEFTRLSRGELARWLYQRAGKADKRFAAGAGEALLDAAGPSLQNLMVELEKLFNYTAGRQVISLEDVRQLCPQQLEENIFAVVDAMGARKFGEAMSGIKDMLAAKEPPLRILTMISRHFRLLLQANDLLERGGLPRDIPSVLNVHPYVAQKMTSQCKNFKSSTLAGAIIALAEIDIALKTGRQEFLPALEVFLLKLATNSIESNSLLFTR